MPRRTSSEQRGRTRAVDETSGRSWIDGRTLDDPRLPLVFVFDRPEEVPAGPRHGGYPKALLEHATKSTRIESVTLSGPGLAPALPFPDTVSLHEAVAPRMQLQLDGELAPTQVGPTLEVGPRR